VVVRYLVSERHIGRQSIVIDANGCRSNAVMYAHEQVAIRQLTDGSMGRVTRVGR
jgi:hypothetical protein